MALAQKTSLCFSHSWGTEVSSLLLLNTVGRIPLLFACTITGKWIITRGKWMTTL